MPSSLIECGVHEGRLYLSCAQCLQHTPLYITGTQQMFVRGMNSTNLYLQLEFC